MVPESLFSIKKLIIFPATIITTLISIIAGILMQTDGECLLSGVNVNDMPDREKTHYRGKHVGFVFQAFNLIVVSHDVRITSFADRIVNLEDGKIISA
jgi:ABC-type lipoprotein export system ATPase subunit